MKSHSDFRVVEDRQDTVFIEDLDLGNVSVTNDAEYVVESILSEYGPVKIIYKDSMGQWDELIHDGINFLGFGPYRGDAPV